MVEKKQETNKKEKKETEKKESKNPKHKFEENLESLIRIFSVDIPGTKNVYVGLTKIKGISWAISNLVCIKLNFPRTKKISELTKEEIQKIEHFLKNLEAPDFLKNRRLDQETGKTEHFLSVDLDLKKQFDIKRLKKIKSYKGMRHSLKLPVRGQRTRSHFRTKGGAAVGVQKKKETTSPAPAKGKK